MTAVFVFYPGISTPWDVGDSRLRSAAMNIAMPVKAAMGGPTVMKYFIVCASSAPVEKMN
jgi:hypothetical protein